MSPNLCKALTDRTNGPIKLKLGHKGAELCGDIPLTSYFFPEPFPLKANPIFMYFTVMRLQPEQPSQKELNSASR